MGQTVAAITPEEARTDLAQENIPYTVEALLEYVETGDTDVVGRFLAIGIDVNAGNEFGETGLMLAAAHRPGARKTASKPSVSSFSAPSFP